MELSNKIKQEESKYQETLSMWNHRLPACEVKNVGVLLQLPGQILGPKRFQAYLDGHPTQCTWLLQALPLTRP